MACVLLLLTLLAVDDGENASMSNLSFARLISMFRKVCEAFTRDRIKEKKRVQKSARTERLLGWKKEECFFPFATSFFSFFFPLSHFPSFTALNNSQL